MVCAMSVVVAVGAGVPFLAWGGDRAARVRPPEKVTDPQPFGGVFVVGSETSGLNSVLSEDGRWAIAGVVGLSKDPEGRIIVQAKEDGDFERDIVVTLPVQVIELDGGDIAVNGIAHVLRAGDTLTLFVEDGSVGGVAAVDCYYDWSQHRCRKTPGGCSFNCVMNGEGGCDCSTAVGPQP